ncbi:MAG: DUF362 domain-containing protein [Syntrophobacteraceae bacterium]
MLVACATNQSTEWSLKKMRALHLNEADSRRVGVYRIPAGLRPAEHHSPGLPHEPSLTLRRAEPKAATVVSHAVGEALRLLGLDPGHDATPEWNPLGDLVHPGDHVVLKPNLIRESHPQRPREWEQVITSPSIIREVLELVLVALRGRGRVTIADGPQTDSDFEEICRRSGLREIVESFLEKGFDVSLLDLRRDRWLQQEGVTRERIALPGDPAGYTAVNLGQESAFADYRLNGAFYGADYDMTETARFHAHGIHTYILCRTVMDADVLINLPKMKTHKKTGVTLGLKNMVGINGYRNCLPHHTMGTPEQKGDELPTGSLKNRVQSRSIGAFKRTLAALGGVGGMLPRLAVRAGRMLFGDTSQVVRSGNWYGNDTAWRMVLDLNKALFYFDGRGVRRTKPLRTLTIVDGIVAGEGNGPVEVDAKPCGVVVAGFNPLAVDTVCAAIMGFDYRKIPMLARGWDVGDLPLVHFGPEAIDCRSNVRRWEGDLRAVENSEHLDFRPHFGWLGHIERHSVGNEGPTV